MVVEGTAAGLEDKTTLIPALRCQRATDGHPTPDRRETSDKPDWRREETRGGRQATRDGQLGKCKAWGGVCFRLCS